MYIYIYMYVCVYIHTHVYTHSMFSCMHMCSCMFSLHIHMCTIYIMQYTCLSSHVGMVSSHGGFFKACLAEPASTRSNVPGFKAYRVYAFLGYEYSI